MKVYFPMKRPDPRAERPPPRALQVLDVDARERFYTEECGDVRVPMPPTRPRS